MGIIENVTSDMVLGLAMNMHYGAIHLKYADLQAKEKMDKIAMLLKIIHKGEYFKHLQNTDPIYSEETKDYIYSPIEGEYKITWGDSKNPPSTLTEDDLNVEKICAKAALESSFINIRLNPAIESYVKKTAKSVGVKVSRISPVEFCINGKRKEEPVYKQLERAFQSGQNSITFNLKEVNAQTLRVYATQFNKFSEHKVSVSVDADKVTVFFKQDDSELAQIELDKAFKYMIGRVGVDRSLELLLSTYNRFSGSVPEWQHLGYESEQEWSDHMKEKAEMNDDYSDTTEPGLSAENADMVWNQDEDDNW